MGYLIYISGPTFGGKTWLTANLIKDLPDLKVVNFERFYIKKDLKTSYIKFYNEIETLQDKGMNVVCDSVYSPGKNTILTKKFEKLIEIVCLPPAEFHNNNYKKFLKMFGWEVTKKRMGGCSVNHIREDYMESLPMSYYHFHGRNYNDILEVVRSKIYVVD